MADTCPTGINIVSEKLYNVWLPLTTNGSPREACWHGNKHPRVMGFLLISRKIIAKPFNNC